jgi:hypothetical protein
MGNQKEEIMSEAHTPYRAGEVSPERIRAMRADLLAALREQAPRSGSLLVPGALAGLPPATARRRGHGRKSCSFSTGKAEHNSHQY